MAALSLLLTSFSLACGPIPTSVEESPDPDDGGDGPQAPAPIEISVDPQDVVLSPGGSYQFSAEQTGGEQPASLAWSAIGGVVSASGRYKAGAKRGDFWVAATGKGGASDTARVRVVEAPPEPEQVEVSPASIQLVEGDSHQFSAEVRDEDGAAIPGDVTWSASGGAITDDGLYTASVEPGTYEVTATTGNGIVGSAEVAVVPAEEPPAEEPPGEDPPNEAPVGSFTVSCAGLTCELDGSGSGDADGTIASHSWDLGDGATASGATTEHTYEAGGQYTVVLTVTDDAGAEATAERSVTVEGAPEAPAGYDVVVEPGDDMQALVEANPSGTSFLVRAGRHVGQSVTPKSGQVFVGEPGAILDGQGTTRFAFEGHDGNPNVEIRGLVIENYDPPVQQGAIRAGYYHDHPQAWGRGWRVLDNEIRYNATGGIMVGPEIVIRGNYIHHNGQGGILGNGDDILIEDNEVAYNNHEHEFEIGFEAGGMKVTSAENLVVRGNHFHHNVGRGIWTDVGVRNALFEDNLVEDNTHAGIMHEVSYDAVIRGNTITGNGDPSQGWAFGAGIVVMNSENVEVYGNHVEGNANGITAIEQDRGGHQTRNLWVHDNTIVMLEGFTGYVQDIGDTSVFSTHNNRFDRNTYHLTNARHFEWMNGWRTEAEWKAYGHDAAGTFHR